MSATRCKMKRPFEKWAADALWASTPESLADSRAWELLRHAGRQVSGGFLDGFKLWYFSSRTRTASHKRLIPSSIIPLQGPVMWLSKFVSCCTCWRRFKIPLWGVCSPSLLLIKVLGLGKCHPRHTRWLAGAPFRQLILTVLLTVMEHPPTRLITPSLLRLETCAAHWKRGVTFLLASHILPASSWRNYKSYLTDSIILQRACGKSQTRAPSSCARAFQWRRRDFNTAWAPLIHL